MTTGVFIFKIAVIFIVSLILCFNIWLLTKKYIKRKEIN